MLVLVVIKDKFCIKFSYYSKRKCLSSANGGKIEGAWFRVIVYLNGLSIDKVPKIK